MTRLSSSSKSNLSTAPHACRRTAWKASSTTIVVFEVWLVLLSSFEGTSERRDDAYKVRTISVIWYSMEKNNIEKVIPFMLHPPSLTHNWNFIRLLNEKWREMFLKKHHMVYGFIVECKCNCAIVETIFISSLFFSPSLLIRLQNSLFPLSISATMIRLWINTAVWSSWKCCEFLWINSTLQSKLIAVTTMGLNDPWFVQLAVNCAIREQFFVFAWHG